MKGFVKYAVIEVLRANWNIDRRNGCQCGLADFFRRNVAGVAAAEIVYYYLGAAAGQKQRVRPSQAVAGPGDEVGNAVVDAADYVCFTGSTPTGTKVGESMLHPAGQV